MFNLSVRSRAKRYLIRLGAFAFSIMLTLLLGELTLRLVHPWRVRTPFAMEDPLLLYRNEPGIEGLHTSPGEFAYHFRINSDGLRGPLVARPKPAAVKRVLCAGDSFTWGTGVEEEESYPAQLARLLEEALGPDQALEVVNGGTMSWGISQYYGWTRREGLAYQPDVVVLAMFQDDWTQSLLGTVIEDESGHLVEKPVLFKELKFQRRLMDWVPGFSWLMTHSQLVNAARDLGRQTVTWPPRTRSFLKEAKEAEEKDGSAGQGSGERALRLATKMLSGIHEALESAGSPLIVLWIPHEKTVRSRLENRPDPRAEFTAGLEPLAALARERGFTMVDSTPALVEHFRRTGEPISSLFFRTDGHVNAVGYRIFAEVVLEPVLEALQPKIPAIEMLTP